MSRRNFSCRTRREKAAKKGKNTFQIKGENKPVSVQQQIHPAEIFRNGGTDRIMDKRFSMNSRHSAALIFGETVGNRNMQRLIDSASTSDAGAIQRSVIQRGIIDWIKKKLGSDPKGAVSKMDSGLDKASKILDSAASKAVGDPALRKKLLKMKAGVDNLKSVSSGVVKVLDARDKVRKVWSFSDALDDIPDDVAANPEKAAKAFGKVFSTAGELGDLLPKGPWTPYLMFLKGFTTFFSDMRYGLVPELKPSSRRYRKYLPE